MMIRKPRVVQAIKFRILPALDTVLMFEGQRYLAVGSKLHTNAKGALVPLIEWRSHCATCGERSTAMTSTPAAIPRGVPLPPDRDTPPMIAAAAAGINVSARATGEAAASE